MYHKSAVHTSMLSTKHS